ncbi:MAG: hypothetical protein WDO15_16370 [Bacteroidota bacterium]
MKTFLCIALLVVATACTQNKPFDASKVGVEWQFGKNNYDGKGNFVATLTFTSESEIPARRLADLFQFKISQV